MWCDWYRWSWSSGLVFHVWGSSLSFWLLFNFLSFYKRLSWFIISKICNNCRTNFLLNFLSLLLLIVQFFLSSLVNLSPILLIINMVLTLLCWQLAALFWVTLILLSFLEIIILDFIPLILVIVIILYRCDKFLLLNLNFLCNNFFNFKRNFWYFNLQSTISKCFLVSFE